MVHIATSIIAVLAATVAAGNSIVARNADDSVAITREGEVYVCARNSGDCQSPQVMCGVPNKRDCEAVLATGGIDTANIIAIAARCLGGSCTHPSA